jgi:uncharacterized protein YhjY with autotransporter beta-barrel domain
MKPRFSPINRPARKRFLKHHKTIWLGTATICFSMADSARADVYTGNQSGGIKPASPPVITAEVRDILGQITPASGVSGIELWNNRAANIVVSAARTGPSFNIVTQGEAARGIVAVSVGVPTAPVADGFLGVPIPTSQSVPGGTVTVENSASIRTSGKNAQGIWAQSSTTGFPPEVSNQLQAFLNEDKASQFTYAVSAVNGVSGNVGTAVAAVLVDEEGAVIPGSAGLVTLKADGTYTFNPNGNFDTLAINGTARIRVNYSVTSTNSTSGTQTNTAVLDLRIRKTDATTFTATTIGSNFEQFGASPNVFPDLAGYVTRLLSTTASGGAGNSVNVVNDGVILTGGVDSHGILATSQGSRGGNGRDASILDSSTPGGNGSMGGAVNVTANGSITTSSNNAVGVLAWSRGGDGGTGGDSGYTRNGKRGGAGAEGGNVIVTGNGTISTSGLQASGILAVSEGGMGGSGGSGSTFNSADDGGNGGRGGSVYVDGEWNITTTGNQAHGIWGKSTGGTAGSGGSGGWTGTSAGGGGIGTPGGSVTIVSGGRIDTWGDDAFGIYAESIGGFGGHGGGSGSIFYASGGNGESAGSGGSVNATNSGIIFTRGERSHGIFAQSVGGGGGSGGGGVALVGIGGSGNTGGDGGRSDVTNSGTITTTGAGSKGVFSQSVGGGGGDGGDAGGLAAVGGKGSATSAGGIATITNTGNVTSTSNALFVQSVGGGGGNGGSSVGWFSFGGSGGGGGNGGNVLLSSSGNLKTTEDNASAIFAQSIGGGGGNGGSSVAGGAVGSLAIGGKGGSGGDAGVVRVGVNTTTGAIDPVTGKITTTGDFSRGIQAQSVGGGGGNGGFATAISVNPTGGSISVGLGGDGGDGGLGGRVDVYAGDEDTVISTSGQDAHGILAQSIGGGGGSGGFSVAASAGFSFAGSLSFGGKGGAGSHAGEVNVGTAADEILGTITTEGMHSYGIFAQSVGGGGGDGGFSVAASLTGGAGGALSFGGGAGSGGRGGNASLYSGANILTNGIDSHGLFVQSVGGGGGSGGFSVAGSIGGGTVNVGFGGSGGSGGLAGNVVLSSTGDFVLTQKDRSNGLFAQSVGGGGGDGGFNISAGISAAPSVGFSMGGSGGTASNAGTVSLTNTSSIQTLGEDSHGIFAQSVGGGGGNGGFSVAAAVSIDPTGSGAGAALNASIGGAGGGGGNGSKVTVTNASDLIDTLGERSHGIFAQSVGGGGGNGGFSVAGSISTGPAVSFSMGGSGGSGGEGGIVELESAGDIFTRGIESHAIFAQSVGGGGGSGGFSVAGSLSANSAGISASIGGSGGNGGDAKSVSIGKIAAVTGNIVTLKDGSIGIAAQSVGGGGGNGGFSVGAGISKSASVNFSLGGGGGAAGDGLDVLLKSAASVATVGDKSHALFAQSVGGGGGNGGFSVTGGASAESGQVGVSIGGSGNSGGDASTVTLTSIGELLYTEGDFSNGIHAQSIGGGGGDGGFSVSGGIGKSTAANFAIGGGGSVGGSAAKVDVTNRSRIYTQGEGSHGLFAQSVGGGGGSGGFAIAGTVTAESNGLTFSMGGSGGGGGLGGKVSVDNAGNIQTGGENGTGKGSHAIFAQSLGGGGGSGGFSGSFTANLGSGSGNALAVSVGGSGEDGEDAESVDVLNTGILETTADDSIGIFAQSVGGGGGNGGFSLAASLGTAAEKTSMAVSIGGSGSGGGDGKKVSVINRNVILTSGDHSQGIFAQSLGGGGGNGGFSVAANGASGNQSKNIGVSVGGAGGVGGDGGLVSVTNTGSIGTSGDDSSAIQAQSIGGGGGNGGFSITGSISGKESKTLAIAVGGSGGAGGIGGTVEVLGTSADVMLSTEGDRSHGVFAQSIGGGGGNGGFSAAVALGAGGDDADKPSTSVAVSVGGSGGSGNVGGNVFVGRAGSVFHADIVTTGEESAGIFAQSVGGGGGTGGFSFAGSANLATGVEGPNNNVAISVGGGGGTGNHGANVDVHHSGFIGTEGDGSHGIQAQSIGGGGGSGGASRSVTLQLGRPLTDEEKEKAAKNKSLSLSIGGEGAGGGDGGIVKVINSGNILTTGGDSYGIFAQSVGGGGGDGGNAHRSFPGEMLLKRYDRAKFTRNLKIVVGGSGGSSGDGKLVEVTHTGNIRTEGMGSHGIVAQSIGGGGGVGGAGAVGLVGNIGVGGGTGTTGDGGNVTVTLTGNIETLEDGANGVFAQSLGGGGGVAGNVDRGFKDYANVGIGLAFGQGGGNAGDGGIVTVLTTGDIITRGVGSNGIMAQSVGGGGGLAGSLGNDLPILEVLNFAGSTGGDGSGGLVNIVHTGDIATLGDASDGIWAQSAGGKDNGGEVKIRITGDIITSGAESNGIFAQSAGETSKGDITINVEGGMVQGGRNTGAGVRFIDGNNNLLTTSGTIQTYDLLLGTAISGGAGNETVDNSGTVNGNVHLGAGTNQFIHRTGALLQSGAVVDLGAGNQFRNQGRISAGAVGTVQKTTLTGNYVQTGAAIWDFDIMPDFESDLFEIDGTATLNGHRNTVNLNEIGIADSEGVYTLVTADSGLLGDFRFGTFTGGTMPVGFTFLLINTDTQLQLGLSESTGDFHWRGAAGNAWNGAFVDGESNWTRDTAGLDFIYGTPGSKVNVFFDGTAAENSHTVLGADFDVNTLTFLTTEETSINGDNTLTIHAADGRGITVGEDAGRVTITSDLRLANDQLWVTDSENLLFIAGETLDGDGFDLAIGGSGTTLIDAAIETGDGSLTKLGTGTLVIRGTNAYTGGTVLLDGFLEIGNASGVGTGSVQVNKGVFRTFNDPTTPANTPLHLAIGGDYSQLLPGELQLRIIGPSGVNDRLVIDGTADLGGTFRPDYSALGFDPVPPAGNYTDEFHILHATGGINGNFDAFVDVHFNPDFLLRWEPVYEANDVHLLWNQHPFTELPDLSDNQISTAKMLNGTVGITTMPLPYNDSTGPALDRHPELRPAFNHLNTQSLANLPVDYDLIAPDELTAIFDSGRAFTQIEAANIENRLREIRNGGGSGFSSRGLNVQKKPAAFKSNMPVEDQFRTIRDGDIYTPSESNRWGVFIAGSADSTDIGNDGNADGFDVETSGVTLGIDYRPNEHSALGLFQQYTNSDADLVNDGTVDVEGMKMGLYGTLHDNKGLYLNGLIAAGFSDYQTKRLGLGGWAKGNTDGWDFDAMLGGGYTKKIGAWAFGPLASLTYSRQAIDSFREEGSMLPLIVDDQAQDSLVSRVGFEVSHEFEAGEIHITPRVQVAWLHEFVRDSYEVNSRLADAPANDFTVAGPQIGKDSIELRASLDVRWSDQFSTYISYQGEYGRSNYDLHSITLGASYQF